MLGRIFVTRIALRSSPVEDTESTAKRSQQLMPRQGLAPRLRRKQMPDTVYSTKVSATGGRHGTIRSDDGLLDLKLALPKTLGGKGDATNPEQLFAGGYAACFENALFHMSRQARPHFPDGDVEVLAHIGLSRKDCGAFVLFAP